MTGSIAATLETGLGVLAKVAVGTDDLDLDAVKNLKDLESLNEFDLDRFGRK